MSRPEAGLAEAVVPLAPIPRGPDGVPVFAEPWEAQAFAMTLALHRAGVFTWEEWAQALGRAIAKAQASGDGDDGSTYYRHWLAALEALVVAKGVSSAGALDERRDAWDRAARATPHGEPVMLGRDEPGA